MVSALCGVAIIASFALTSTAKAGLLGTGEASYCDPSLTKAFFRFGDSANYARLLNGGSYQIDDVYLDPWKCT